MNDEELKIYLQPLLVHFTDLSFLSAFVGDLHDP